jgi:plastocyanin
MRPRLPLLLITALITVSCGGGGGYSTGPSTNPGTNPGTGNPTTPTSPVSTTSVAVSDNQFTPKDIQVAIGATVTWTWVQGAIDHNVTFAGGPASGNLKSGATFTRTFPAAGTFNYSCTLHSGMTGTVLVK